MEKFNKDLLLNYKPSTETFEKGMDVTAKLGKINTRMSNIFYDFKIDSRLFAFIESKYSSKIEGIYTTLFDVVNTGIETNQEKIIRPLVESLLEGKQIINKNEIKKIEEVMNSGQDRNKRWDPRFGVYKGKGKTKVKIYEPLMDKNEVEIVLDELLTLMNDSPNVVKVAHYHLFFEKLHPFVDANGRIGRLLLTRQLVKITNFSDVLPLSWSIFTNQTKYYEIFDIKTNEDIDIVVKNLLDIIIHMYNQTKRFLIRLDEYVKDNLEHVKSTSNKITDNMAKNILLNLQIKNTDLINTYGLNPRTIDSIFNKITNIDFNVKTVRRKKVFWNIQLETIIDQYFGS